MRVYYTNAGFVDQATGHYQVAAVDENEPGYAVHSTWPTYEEAQHEVRRLNTGLGVNDVTVLRVVSSSMGAQNARDDQELRRRVTDLEHDYPVSSLVRILRGDTAVWVPPIVVPETGSVTAQFLELVRDAFIRVIGEHLEDGDDLSEAIEHATDESDDVLRDCVTPMVTERWEIFTALRAWDEDVSDWDGTGLDLTDLAAYALVERGRRIWAALIEVLDGDTDD